MSSCGQKGQTMKKSTPLSALPIALFLLMAIFGCSNRNDEAPLFSETGKHPAIATWYTDHRAEFSRNPQQCTQCHGSDLQGGISKVNCFTGVQGIPGFPCHADGHAPRIVPHALPFKDATKHGPVAKSDLVFCQVCHGTAGGAGSNPRFNTPVGSMANGCEDCHITGTAHPPVNSSVLPGYPANWTGHSSAGNMASVCNLCHGVTLSGPEEGGTGPACKSCHTQLQAGIIPEVGSCNSCHENSPTSLGHPVHLAMVGAADNCTSCHSGSGSGGPSHFNGLIDVVMLSKFNAKNGTALYSNGSCSQTSCHGGNVTPAWGNTLDVATECALCHQRGTASQTPHYNSYFSGEHALHLNSVGLSCPDCHDMTVSSNGASHFSNMGTPSFELSPSKTVRVPGYATSPGSCNPTTNPPAGSYSVGVCHGSKNW